MSWSSPWLAKNRSVMPVIVASSEKGAERSNERSISLSLFSAWSVEKISVAGAGMLVHRNQSTTSAAPT
jgi:hypothetical protein